MQFSLAKNLSALQAELGRFNVEDCKAVAARIPLASYEWNFGPTVKNDFEQAFLRRRMQVRQQEKLMTKYLKR